jgi:hypothetical protein
MVRSLNGKAVVFECECLEPTIRSANIAIHRHWQVKPRIRVIHNMYYTTLEPVRTSAEPPQKDCDGTAPEIPERFDQLSRTIVGRLVHDPKYCESISSVEAGMAIDLSDEQFETEQLPRVGSLESVLKFRPGTHLIPDRKLATRSQSSKVENEVRRFGSTSAYNYQNPRNRMSQPKSESKLAKTTNHANRSALG